MGMSVGVGDKAPAFTLPARAAEDYSLADYAGQAGGARVLPGRRHAGVHEAAELVQRRVSTSSRRRRPGAGASPAQDVDSHERFAAKHGFGFPLLADTDKEVAGAVRHARAARVPAAQRVRRRRRRRDPLRPPGDRRADVPARPSELVAAVSRRRSTAAEIPGIDDRSRTRVEPVFDTMRVLGIDPGLTRCGYAVLDAPRPGQGVARRTRGAAHARRRSVAAAPRRAARRARLADRASSGPQSVAVEQVFFQVNVRTAMSVGQASRAWPSPRPPPPAARWRSTRRTR